MRVRVLRVALALELETASSSCGLGPLRVPRSLSQDRHSGRGPLSASGRTLVRGKDGPQQSDCLQPPAAGRFDHCPAARRGNRNAVYKASVALLCGGRRRGCARRPCGLRKLGRRWDRSLLRRKELPLQGLGRQRRVLRLPESRLRERKDRVDADGNASIVAANEPWHVSGAGTHALQLGPGATARSSSLPVSLLDPWIRFFARSAGANGSLRVQVIFHGLLGNLTGLLNVGSLSPGSYSSWQPTQRVLSALALPLGTTSAQVQLRRWGRREVGNSTTSISTPAWPSSADGICQRLAGKSARLRRSLPASFLVMATRAATPWGPADLVEELTVSQQAGTKRFSSKVQLLETAKGRAARPFLLRRRRRRHARAGDASGAGHRTAESRSRRASRARGDAGSLDRG
jgi:hypothetical protein